MEQKEERVDSVRLEDRLQWWMNRKPASQFGTYWGTTVSGVILGGGSVMAFCYLGLGSPWYFPLAIFGFSIAYFLTLYRMDKKRGYVGAIYQHYLKRREELGRRLGKL